MKEIEDFERMQQQIEDEEECESNANFLDEEFDSEDVASRKVRKQVKKYGKFLMSWNLCHFFPFLVILYPIPKTAEEFVQVNEMFVE